MDMWVVFKVNKIHSQGLGLGEVYPMRKRAQLRERRPCGGKDLQMEDFQHQQVLVYSSSPTVPNVFIMQMCLK